MSASTPASTARLLAYRRLVLIPPVIAAALYAYFVRSYSSQARRKRAMSTAQAASEAVSKAAHSGDSEKAVAPDTAGATTIQRSSSKSRVGVNAQFFQQMRKLLPILVPGVLSRESLLLTALAGVLVARTWLDIWYVCVCSCATCARVPVSVRVTYGCAFHAHLTSLYISRFSAFNGQVVKAIVSRDRATFVARAVIEFGLMMWPLSIVNNSLKFLINALSLSFRMRLTEHAHDAYLSGITFYKVSRVTIWLLCVSANTVHNARFIPLQVSNIDNRVQNADQLLTQDIDKFAENLAHLYSDISKPIVDICLFAYKLGQAMYVGVVREHVHRG